MCAGSAVTLSANNCGDGAVVRWSTGDTGSTLNLNAPSTNTNYTFTCTYPSTCVRYSSTFTLRTQTCTTDPCAGASTAPTWVDTGAPYCQDGRRYQNQYDSNQCSSSNPRTQVRDLGPCTTGSSFVLIPPSFNCSTNQFTFQTTGGNGSTIRYYAPGITNWTLSAGVFNINYDNNTVFNLQACQGCDANISGGTFVTYSWNPSAYCSNQTVKPAPPVVNNVTICAGQGATLMANGCSGQILWSTGYSGNPLTLAASALTTTRSFTAICQGQQNSDPATATVTVNPNPIAIPKSRIYNQDFGTLTSQTLCAGGNIAFGMSPYPIPAGYTLQWKAPNGDPRPVNENWDILNVTNGNAGTYTYTVTDNNGCSSSATVNVMVISAPTITGNLSICAGSNTTLTASCPYGGTPNWTNGSLIVSAAGTYTATCSGNGCTSPISSVTVTQRPANQCTTGGTLTLLVPTFNCSTHQFIFNTSGGDGTPVRFFSVGITGWTTSTGPFYPDIYPDTKPFNLIACQGCDVNGYGGTQVNYSWDAIAYCNKPAKPAVTSSTICAGQSAVLSATGCSGQVQWSTGQTGTSILISATALTTTTSFTATCQVGSYSSDPATGMVTVLPLPIPSISGSLNICAGQTTALTANGGGTYRWSTGATTAAITASTAGTYSVTVTSGSGCSAVASANVVVYAMPAAPTLTASSTSLCPGGTSVLTASGCSGTVTWSTGATGSNSITVSPAVSTTYNAICTTFPVSGIYCQSANASIGISVNAVPVASIAGNLSICAGQTTTLTASGGSTYRWSTGAITAAISASTAGTYSVTVTTGAGCSAVTSAGIVVNPLPTASIVGSLSICTGQTTTITASGGSSYRWSTGALTAAVSVSVAGTYSVTVTNGSGCSVVTSANVVINAQPVASISGNLSICAGQTTTLTASGGSTYQWNTGAMTAAISASVATTYSVTVSNGAGCLAVANASVSISSAPVASIVGTLSVCAGQSTTLTATGGSSYRWSTGATTSSITAATAGPYSVTVTAGTGCSAVTSATLVVNSVPTASIAGNLSICAGQSTVLTANGGSTYRWSTGATTAAITASTAGTYSVTVSSGAGCSAVASANVVVNALPTASISGNLSLCAGQTTILTGIGGSTYRWSTGATTAAVSVSTAGTYSLTVTSGAGCSALTSASVMVNAVPVASIAGNLSICAGQTTTLTASGGNTYRWTTGATTSTLSVSVAGTYSVTVTSGTGCSAVASANVVVNAVPMASIAGNLSLCAGQSTTLTASGGTNYTWSTGQTTQSIIISPAATTPYSVTAGASGCIGAPATQTVTVGLKPAKPTSASATPIAINKPTSVTLTAAGCSGTLRWEYANGSVLAGNVVSVSATTTFGVRCQNALGCLSDTASVTIRYLNLPLPTIGQYPTAPLFCGPANMTLTANGCPVGSTPKWWNGSTGQTLMITLTTSTTLSAVCTQDGLEGPSSNTIPITIRTAPTISSANGFTIGQPISLKYAQTLSLTAVAPGANGIVWRGPVDYSWPEAALTRIGVTSDMSGLYTAVASYTSNACSTSAVVTVIIDNPLLGTQPITPASYCAGSILTVPFATTDTFGSGNVFTVQLSDVSGSFANPTSLSGTVAANAIVVTLPLTTPPGTGYRVRLMGSNPQTEGEASSTILTISAPPSVSAMSNSPAGQVSIGDTLRLTTSGQNLTGATYTWSGPNNYAATVANPAIPKSTTANNGIYTLTLRTSGGCTVTAQTSVSLNADTSHVQRNIRIKSVDATLSETDLIPRVNGGLGSLNLSVEELDGQSLAGYTYLWTRPVSTTDTTPATATSITLTGGQVGEYKVLLTKGRDTLIAYTTIRSKPCRQVAHTYRCGVGPATPILDSGSLGLSSLAPGDTIRTGDFDVIVTQILSGGAGNWTGKGYTEIPYLQGQQIAVEFTNAFVNDCYEFTGRSGIVQSTFDPSWSGVVDIDAGIDLLKKAAEQVDILLSAYKGTPDQITAIQNTIVPLLEQYKDNPQAADLIDKLNHLSKDCKTSDPNAGTLSAACQLALKEVQMSYDSLQKIIDELPPFPDELLSGQVPSPNGRVAASDSPVPDITLAELNGCATLKDCATKVGCSCGGKVTKYYGQLYGPGDEFWLIETGGKKYYIWRGYSLTKEIWGFCPVGEKEYTAFYPTQGITAGAAFADAGQKFVFEIGLVMATGGGSTVTEEVIANVGDAFVSALAESNGDWDKFQASLGTNLLFTSVGLTPEAAKRFKKFLIEAKPYFSQFASEAAKKLITWKTSTGWLSDVLAGVSKLTPNEATRVKSFLNGTLNTTYELVVKQGGSFKKLTENTADILDQNKNRIATFIKQGSDYALDNIKWASDNIQYIVRQRLKGVKFRRAPDGLFETGDLELVEEICNSGGRLSASTNSAVTTSGCNLLLRVVARLRKFRIADIDAIGEISPIMGSQPYFSRATVDRFADKFIPDETRIQQIINKIKDLGDLDGTRTESVSDLLFERDGFLMFDGKIGSNNGFDGVYVKGTLSNIQSVIINDAKPIYRGRIELSAGNAATSLPNQMSRAWIQYVLDGLKGASSQQSRDLGNALQREWTNNPSKFIRTVTAVEKDTGKVVILKLDSLY